MNTKQLFQGTGSITKLLLRQNRLRILIWLAVIIGTTVAVIYAYQTVYMNPTDITGYALTMENPAMVALLGTNYATEDFNIGVVFATEMLLFTAIGVAVMNILFMSSSTRQDEEAGRLELIRSLPVGRLAYLTAAIALILLINLLLFLLLFGGLLLAGSQVVAVESALLYSLIQVSTGLFFAGVSALMAQLVSTSQATNRLSFGILIVSYILRAYGDVNSETIALLSPLGWTVRTSVFADNHWWPVLALIAGSIILIISAVGLNYQRDMNSSILPERKGNRTAPRWLLSLPGLVWRQEGGTLIAWLVGFFVLSAAFGAILGDFETYFSDMDFVQQILYASAGVDSLTMLEQLIGFIMGIMALFGVIPAVNIMNSLSNQEALNRTELIYSRPVSRSRVFMSYYCLAIIAALAIQVLNVLGLYLGAEQVIDNNLSFQTYFSAGMVLFVGMWVIIGLAALFVGWEPRLKGFVWLYLVFTMVVLYLSQLLNFPAWLNNLSVFHHIPMLPFEDMTWKPLILNSGIALILTIVGYVGYNKRDITG